MDDLPTLVYVVDDDPAVRKGLERLLRSAGHAVRSFVSALAWLDAPREPASAACLVLDIRMPGLSGLELQERLQAGEWKPPIVFMTGHGDIPTSVQAMKAGAVNFLTKPFDEASLLAGVDEALRQDRLQREQHATLAEAREREARLTAREHEVFERVVRGWLNKQVAGDLGISEKTVKVHRANVMSKLGVQSVAELVRLAARLGIAGGGDATVV